MNNFTDDLPYQVYSEAELAQKREVSETMSSKVEEFLKKNKIYTAVHGETNDKYVLNHCDTPKQKKAEKKVRVEMTINPESAEKYSRLKGGSK